ncbi:polysaccharide pyruvyl transferase family protein [Hydrocarboniphaga sp.]|uniref:polysaccharide pyruvyl transferase family protein n=1 Tax=Hydrocarboniphaga sp. TaxID=2033016 RepID=UPI002ABA6DF4|nr:polysaccharide pyruvyl transferase family protein [Hydrocarboniphaga sp.]MDZ4078357.1 polysaccharide pyruvyl transferase family protein [Hydrocarboniphaga sp.]
MKTVALLWHNYPSDNLGVGALSYSNIAIIDNALDAVGEQNVEYLAIGMLPSAGAELSKITKRQIKYVQFSLSRFVKERKYRHLLIAELSKSFICFDLSEGDSFTDIYGYRRLIQQSASKILIHKLDIPLVLCPQTIGPFKTKLGIAISSFIMSRCTKIFARDSTSYRYLQDSDLSSISTQTTDLAFSLPYEKRKSLSESIKVGINVSGLLYSGGYGHSNQFGLSIDYKQFTDQLITYFSQKPGVELHLVAHVISDLHPTEDDYTVSSALATQTAGIILAPRFGSPVEAKSYISGLDFFIGARMHACIAAFSAEVPVIPVAYSRKFSGLFGSLKYGNLIDGQRLTSDDAFLMVKEAFENRENILKQIKVGLEIANELLSRYRSYVAYALRKFGDMG